MNVKSGDVSQIVEDFQFLLQRREVLAVLLFGSYAKGEATERSDIDICIVAPEAQKRQLLSFVLRNLRRDYHVWLFEELPMYMKKEVMDNHRVLICRSLPELYEYFYFVRKLWKDQEHRQRVTKEDLRRMLRR